MRYRTRPCRPCSQRCRRVQGWPLRPVPGAVSVDGIRVYLPADNRLDFGRFLTPDIAELQVAMGYASVLDGPGAMGGAINLVTRKPTKALEAELRGTLNLDRGADYAGYNVFALLGTKHDTWYAQASFARSIHDHWDLPGRFVATPNENGAARDFSRTQDWRVNAKVGFTPNATDEYTLSYTRQEGAKNAPLHITDSASNISLRNWSWPYWNIEGIYFLSATALGDHATLKTRAYWNKYTHLLRSWDNRLQNSQILDLSESLRLTVGGSFDWRETAQAEEYSLAAGLFSLPLINASGWNAQGRLDWIGESGTTAYASVWSRVRFPTIFERFSSQFNAADPNPALLPERATNLELGAAHRFGPVHLSAAAYYSHLNDALATIRTGTTTTPNNLNRRVNIGSADYYGIEFSVDAQITPTLKVGGNYSFIHRDFDVGAVPVGTSTRPFALTDVPGHEGFIWASWRPVPKLEFVPSVEFASDRTTVTVVSTVPPALVPNYYATGAYANVAFRIDYEVQPSVTAGIGGRNLFDQYVILTDGFPEPGRTFFASVRARY
ncbi:MAG: TonB-dependent receptor [Novosphingobium sp.]